MKKVLFVTSCTRDVRALCYDSMNSWKVSMLEDVRQAPQEITANRYDFVFFDLGLTGAYAPDLLERITAVRGHPPVFILSRECCFSFYSLAQKAGACGYFQIPYRFPVLLRKIDRFFAAAGIPTGSGDGVPGDTLQGDTLLGDTILGDTILGDTILGDTILGDTILGASLPMRKLRQDILALRMYREPVLIQGETGSGKDLAARALHEHSPVAAGPYRAWNASCITASLAESTLFGTCKGSYTDAGNAKGLFESADGGTLFIDEIGELDMTLQPKLLRVLEDKEVHRLGSASGVKVDFRLVCATNRCLRDTVASGDFRADLYHRLDVLRLYIPPLRDHPEDIPLLVSGVLQTYRKVLSNNALEILHDHPWPGNVRQLHNCVVRASCNASGDVIYPDQIQF